MVLTPGPAPAPGPVVSVRVYDDVHVRGGRVRQRVQGDVRQRVHPARHTWSRKYSVILAEFLASESKRKIPVRLNSLVESSSLAKLNLLVSCLRNKLSELSQNVPAESSHKEIYFISLSPSTKIPSLTVLWGI